MAKQIRTNEAVRVVLTEEEGRRASGGGFSARPGTCPPRVLPAQLGFQTGLERTGADVDAGMIQHQIWDVAAAPHCLLGSLVMANTVGAAGLDEG